MMDEVVIDGAQGEGGGQVLRTSLSLSLVTGRPFRIENIRARRDRPGLMRQHLAAVRAAAEVGGAEVEGASLGSMELSFAPGPIRPGDYRFDVGSAGSATLVFQTVLPALLASAGPSALRLEGGTHNLFAPPYDFLAEAFLPVVNRMGPRVSVALDRYGFFPAGGGAFDALVEPTGSVPLRPLSLMERGRVRSVRVRALVSRLRISIGERELAVVAGSLGRPLDAATVEEVESVGPGNIVLISVIMDSHTEVFTGYGKRGVPAETVAAGVASEAKAYLEAGVPVGSYLSDQLLIPLAMAGAGSFRAARLTLHAETNMAVIKRFLPVRFDVEERNGSVEIRVLGR